MDINIPNWDEYFMLIAKSISTRSKDPNTKVGAVLVDNHNRIVGTGYNGMPPGIPQHIEMPLWEKPTKYDYVIHAEMNSILHANKSARGCTLYVTLFPCKDCAKLIASSGVKRIVYLDDRYDNPISRNIFEFSYIKLERLQCN